MTTLITNQNTPENLPLVKAKPAAIAARQIVTVSSGEASFGVDTKLIQNLVQASEAKFVNDRQAIKIGNETIPVIPLQDLLGDVTAASTTEAKGGTLLIVRSKSSEKSLAVRVDAVSRPEVIEDEKFYNLPACTYSGSNNEFIESLAVTHTETDAVRMQLIINPLKAVGLDDQQVDIEKSVGRLDRVITVDANQSKGQMVVFSPAGVGTDLDFQFCLPLPYVAEIIQTDDESTFSMPMSMSKITGMVMWRGIPVPVIDLAKQFNITSSTGQKSGSRLMVCHLGQGQHVAFYTQVQIRTLRTPNATQTNAAWLSGMPKLAVVESEYGILVVPDLKSILNG